ncbi:hypothetical protein ACFE04_002340 [Oxalis oulophora]
MHSHITAAATTVVFTTPEPYATRLSDLLALKNHTPLWLPTIATTTTPHTLHSLSLHLTPPNLQSFSAIAFPSRTSISAVKSALTSLNPPLLRRSDTHAPLILAALGKDAELIDNDLISKLGFENVKILVPEIATPSGLVTALGNGGGQKVLCPVPAVVELTEPPVVPDFLKELEDFGWVTVRVDAYETRWLGPKCAEKVVARAAVGEGLEAIVFTSSGEVEGLLKSLRDFGLDWAWVRRKWPNLVVAAHGPVTAAGARRLGVDVDLVSHKFDSFAGVVDALDFRLPQ